MVNDTLKLSALVGRIFAEEIDSEAYNGMVYDKELATITEKAIVYSQRSKKPMNECVYTKTDEMKKGLLFAKEHGMDDYTRGFIIGYILKSVFDNSIDTMFDVLDGIENDWDMTWNEKEGSQINNFVELVKMHYRKLTYKQIGLITVQDLTRICLEMVNNGFKDKYLVFDKSTQGNDIIKGVFNNNFVDIETANLNLDNRINKHDIILLS